MQHNQTQTYELPNVGDNRKSFYGKAIVKEDDTGKHLFSYGQKICSINNKGCVEIDTSIPKWDSQTSLRHIKSFLQFFGKSIGSKTELLNMYCNRVNC